MAKYKLYVGSYTEKSAEKFGAGKGIYICEFDSDQNNAAVRSITTDCVDPSFLLIKGSLLYAVEERPRSSVIVYQIDGDSLKKQESLDLGKKDTCHLEMTSDGRYLIAANYGSGSLSVISLTPQGFMDGGVCVIEEPGSSVHPRQAVPHVHSSLYDAENDLILTANLGRDTLTVYRPDRNKNTLYEKQCVYVPAGRGPRHMAFTPDHNHLLAVCEISSSLLNYAYDKANGIEDLIEEIPLADPKAAEECKAADLHFSPDGKNLYVSVRGSDCIIRFSYKEGKLKKEQESQTFGKGPRNFCLTPDGKFLIAANEFSGTVVVFRIDSRTGAVQERVAALSIPRAVFVTAEMEA